MEPVERLVALEEIRQLTYTYGWGIDTKDADLVASVFAPDGRYDNRNLGLGDYPDREAIRKAFADDILPYLKHGQHAISNHRVEFTDDDHAEGTCYIVGEGIGLDDNYIQAHGAYVDSYVRTPEGWRISFRKFRELMPLKRADFQDQ